MYVCAYLSIFSLPNLPIYLSIYVSVGLSVCLFVRLAIYLSISTCLYLSIWLSVYWSLYLCMHACMHSYRSTLQMHARDTISAYCCPARWALRRPRNAASSAPAGDLKGLGLGYWCLGFRGLVASYSTRASCLDFVTCFCCFIGAIYAFHSRLNGCTRVFMKGEMLSS